MKINLHVFIFVLIALITSINDIFIYSLKIKYSIGLILSVIILVIVSILLIKKNKIKIINNLKDYTNYFNQLKSLIITFINLFKSNDYDINNTKSY